MTFLATYDGQREPGYINGKARTKEIDGATFYDWPQPWGFRCDECRREFPYGCVAISDRAKLSPPTVRQVDHDGHHRCAFCEGYVEPAEQPEQLAFEVAA